MATTQGQPTRYKPEYCELAHNYSLLGATGETLADFFGVASRTVDNWMTTHPDFADAVHRGRAVADGVIVRALFERARGFSHKVTRTALYQGQEREITNTVSYPPDTQACMFWLRNRQRPYWQARAEAKVEEGPDIAAEMAALAAGSERALISGSLAEIAEIPRAAPVPDYGADDLGPDTP